MFYPIEVAVRDALLDQELLPADDGTFVSAINAKLASAEWLRKLLRGGHLRELLKTEKPLKWISGDITETANTDLWEFIRKQLNVEEITPPRFATKIDETFLENQNDQWLIDFYISIQESRTFSTFEETPLLRLESGKHIKPFKDDGSTPAGYLPPASGEIDPNKFLLVKYNIASNPLAQKFLREVVQISEPDRVAVVIECLLPGYTLPSIPFDEQMYIGDLQQISEAFQHANEDARKRLIYRLSSTAFVACHPQEIPTEHKLCGKSRVIRPSLAVLRI